MTSSRLTRRRLAIAAALLIVGALVIAEWSGLRRSAWRTIYPNLPPIVQVLPYRAAAEFRRIGADSVDHAAALPTARAVEATSSVADHDGATSDPTTRQVVGSTADEQSEATAGSTIDTLTQSVASASIPSIATADALPSQRPISATQPTASIESLPMQASVDGLRHEYQTWNNCGPATIAMAMRSRQWEGDQRNAAPRLKPDPDDKNVGPEELARFARESGLQAIVRSGGTIDLLRALIADGFPVIVETWFIPDPGDEMGHYVLLDGFDATARTFSALDSYNGPNVTLDFDEFDALWRVFGRLYLVVYEVEDAPRIEQILGPDMHDESMWVAAAATARQESLSIDDAYAHFNLGTALLALGDVEASAAAFDTARSRGLPWRMLWYQFGPYESYAAVGRWDDVFALADATLARMPNLEESLYWRGRAHEATGNLEAAGRDWRRALEINSLYQPPTEALSGLQSGGG